MCLQHPYFLVNNEKITIKKIWKFEDKNKNETDLLI